MRYFCIAILTVLSQAKKPLWPPVISNGPNNSTVGRKAAMSYDTNCMGCIVNGYQYCNDF